MKKALAFAALLLTNTAQAHQSSAEGTAHALEHALFFGLLGVIAYVAVKTLNKGRLTPIDLDKKR